MCGDDKKSKKVYPIVLKENPATRREEIQSKESISFPAVRQQKSKTADEKPKAVRKTASGLLDDQSFVSGSTRLREVGKVVVYLRQIRWLQRPFVARVSLRGGAPHDPFCYRLMAWN